MSAVPGPGMTTPVVAKPFPVSERRKAAHKALLQGRTGEGKAGLRALWREAPGPERAEDAVLLMATLGRENQIKEALALLSQGEAAALSTASLADLAAALATNLPRPAEAAVQIQMKRPATTSAATAAVLARLHERSRDIRGAVPLWEIAARLAPEESTYRRELTRLYAVTANARGLENALRALVALEPRDFSSRVNLVRTLERNGRREEALRSSRLPEEFLQGPEREVAAGEVLLRATLAPDALGVFDGVLKADPDHCEARYGRARALVATREKAAMKKGEGELFALAEKSVGGLPCKVVSAVRELALRETWPHHRKRLLRLKKRGKSADPAALEGVLEALGEKPLPTRPPPGTTRARRVGPSHYAID